MEDKYYLDYRIGEIVKNLDTTFLAPEQYNEVIKDNLLHGIYKYTYVNDEGMELEFPFTMGQVMESNSFADFLDEFAKENNFVISDIVKKVLYLNNEEFDKLYNGEEE